MTDAETLLAKIKQQNRIRQQEYYKRHKDAVNEKRRTLYKAGKNALKGMPLQYPFIEPIDELIAEPVIETPVIIPLTKSKKAKKGKPTKNVITYEDALAKLTQLRAENTIKTDGTLKKYKEDLKRFLNITGCEDLSECLAKHNVIIKEVNNGKKKNGQRYKNNVIKDEYQLILYLIDNLPLPEVDKQPYKYQYDLRILQSNDDNAEKKKTETVYPFKTYLGKVKDKFGADSKMYLIGSMYDELTVRDNFQLKIVSNINDMTNDKLNYLLVPRSGNLKIVINTYKTEAKYGVINHTFTKQLSTMIRKYMSDNSIKIGDYLFGDKPLTQFVSSNNPKIGIQAGINLFRQMKISDEEQTIKSPAERLALADKMRHSPVSQLWYLRKQKLI